MVVDEERTPLDSLMRTRCRIVVFGVSAAGLLLLSLVFLLRSSASTLVPIPPASQHHKVSVILCTPHASTDQFLHAYNSLKRVLSKNKLEYEFFVVSLHLSSSSPQLMSLVDSYHFLSYSGSCAESAYYALEHSHYSVILYLSSNITSYELTIPKLVGPVLQGKSDLVFLKDSTKLPSSLWERFLHLLLLPITGTTHVPDTPTFAMLSSVWFHGCHGITSGRGSLTIDILSRCTLRHWQTVQGQTTPPYEEPSLQFSQVIDLWWYRHPVVGAFLVIATILAVVFVIYKYSKYQNNHSKNTIHI